MSERSHVQESLLKAFREEFQEDLASVRQEWEAYKPGRKTRLDDLADLRRLLHTIKGSTRLLGFDGVPERVHALEEMVLESLRKKKKPAEFWDDLADLEEDVARHLGEAAPEPSLELELSPMAASALSLVAAAPLAAPTSSTSAAYSFLLSVDDLVVLGESLVEELQAEGQDHGGPVHRAALLVERTRALREQARRMTLLPISELFAGMTELARRTATETGKTVRVTHHIEPGQMERETVAVLRPALLHLVSNAVSHGVTGSSGVIEFSYQRFPGYVTVSVADQGAGISLSTLREAVLKGRHLSAGEWDALDRQAQLDWIFHPGLSTRTEADLSAGRGMGLSIVAETVQRLGGRAEVQSSDKGTLFRLVLPSNWNLRTILRVRSGGQELAVLSSEIAAVEARALGGQVAERAGELASLVGFPGAVREGSYRLLLARGKSGHIAVGVEELGEFEHVLVTPPPLGLTGLTPAVIGVTSHRGMPMPVLSLRALLDAPLLNRGQAPMELQPIHGPLLLVVDDSVTTRTMVSGILQSSGYRVLTASDGKQGLEMAHTPGISGIVSDLQMPIMDGLEFLEALRADPITSAIPFILLTSIDDVATFEKASGLGADRCLGKQNFTEQLLLKTVEELL